MPKKSKQASPTFELKKYEVLRDQPVRKTSKAHADQKGTVKKGMIVICEERLTVDGVEKMLIRSQIQDKAKLNGWVRAKEKGQVMLVDIDADHSGPRETTMPAGLSKAEQIKWKKRNRDNVLPTLYAETTANPLAGRGPSATPGAIPGEINWGIKPVSIAITESGKMGVTWVPVRSPKTGSEAITIETLEENGLLDKHRQLGALVCPGLALGSVGAETVAGMAYADVIELLKSAPRPLSLTFAGVACDAPDNVQAALVGGTALPSDIPTSMSSTAGSSKVAQQLKKKEFAGTLGRKRTAQPVKAMTGEGGEQGCVDIIGAAGSKSPGKMIEHLPYLEIESYFVEKGTKGLEPGINFLHRPDPQALGRKIMVYMPAEQATEMADALMLLLQEVAEKRNPDLVLADGQDATSALAGSLFAAEGPDEET